MFTTIVFAAWCFIGMICIGLARIKVPNDTSDGQANPEVAWIAWIVMLLCWPLAIWHRNRFARYGDPRDFNNPSWLAEGRPD